MKVADIRKIQKDLSKKIKGHVWDSSDGDYQGTISIDNGRVEHQPYLVAVPEESADVAAIISYCKDQGINLTTKSGGHSATGYSLNSTGIVLDLNQMNSIVPGSTDNLHVGAGAKWIQVYDYLRLRHVKRTAVGGGCPGVGVGGFLLGGGYSFVSRSYGLGSDNINSMEFVSANGDILKLDGKGSNNENELYWALKGAGGGNFGIVTNFDIQTRETQSERMMMGQVTFPFYKIADVLSFYDGWVKTLPKEMALYGMMRYFPDPRQNGKKVLCLRFTPIYNGSLSEGISVLEPLLKLGPEGTEFHSMSIPEWENFIGNVTLVRGKSAYIRSLTFPNGSLTKDFSEICKKFMVRCPSQDSYIVWTHMGGEIRSKSLEDSCFAHRDAEYTFEIKSIWDIEQPQLQRKNVEWALNFFDELESCNALGAYINYIDPLLDNWQEKYYRDTYSQLLKIKSNWDKDNFFNFQQSIGSTYSPDLSNPVDLSPLSRTFL